MKNLILLSLMLFLASCDDNYNKSGSKKEAESIDTAFENFKESARTQKLVLLDSAKKGEILFLENCSACHSVSGSKLIGPNLAGVTNRRPMQWLIKFTKNAPAMIKSKDSEAVKLFEEYDKMQMNSFENLSDDEIRLIYNYIEVADNPVY